MPLLGMLQNQGRAVALVTDGRLSGASGKVPAAIHMTPEAAIGGPIACVRDGDRITLDCEKGTLQIDVEEAEWAARTPASNTAPAGQDLGRALFAFSRTMLLVSVSYEHNSAVEQYQMYAVPYGVDLKIKPYMKL
jgi:phosphogluconate dehydratase